MSHPTSYPSSNPPAPLPQYTFLTLPLPRNHIRLLTLTRSSASAPLSATITEHLLPPLAPHAPYFVAISWTWPSRSATSTSTSTFVSAPTPSHPDAHLPILPRLNALFHDLLPSEGVPASVRIWIDAVCINQANPTEKAMHVPLMHRVYGMATGCWVWLGGMEEGGGSALVVDEGRMKGIVEGLRRVEAATGTLGEREEESVPRREDPFWRALGRLCNRDWWFRTWVVQEVAIARRVDVNAGGRWVAWDVLVELVGLVMRLGRAEWCCGPRSTGRTKPNGFGVLMDLNWTRRMFQGDAGGDVVEVGMDMGYLLRMVRLKEVTRPVDKIYGLLGLVGEEVRGLVNVDYLEEDEGFYKAYEEFVRRIVGRYRMEFWLLCMAPSRERPVEMASWCPNFNSLNPNYLDLYHQPFHPLTSTLASSSSAPGISVDPSNPKHLRILGREIDIVEEVIHIGGPYLPAVDHEDNTFSSATESFLAKSRLCLETATRLYASPDEGKSAYTRALIMNTGSDFQLIPQDHSDDIRDAYDATVVILDSSEANLSTGSTPETAASNLAANQLESGQAYIKQLGWWQERPIFFTKQGRVGRGSWAMLPGDLVCGFYGAGPLFLLRHETEDGNVSKLVGDVYLHGCMEGEGMMTEKGDARKEGKEFVLL